jgi:hypothetical protein
VTTLCLKTMQVQVLLPRRTEPEYCVALCYTQPVLHALPDWFHCFRFDKRDMVIMLPMFSLAVFLVAAARFGLSCAAQESTPSPRKQPLQHPKTVSSQFSSNPLTTTKNGPS